MTRTTPARSRPPSGPLLDVEQAAERLGVGTRFIRRLVEQRRIPFHKIGKYVRFDEADLAEYADRARVESTRQG